MAEGKYATREQFNDATTANMKCLFVVLHHINRKRVSSGWSDVCFCEKHIVLLEGLMSRECGGTMEGGLELHGCLVGGFLLGISAEY